MAFGARVTDRVAISKFVNLILDISQKPVDPRCGARKSRFSRSLVSFCTVNWQHPLFCRMLYLLRGGTGHCTQG